MSVEQLRHLDDCFACGSGNWEPRRHADGEPYLRCGGCGRTTRMPAKMQRAFPIAKLPRDRRVT